MLTWWLPGCKGLAVFSTCVAGQDVVSRSRIFAFACFLMKYYL